MEGVTLGQISNVLIFAAGILTSGGVVVAFMSKKFSKIMQEHLKPVNDKIDGVSEQVKQVDIDNCKNYLQQMISALDAGATLDNAARERFYENYDHYTKDLHLNSWVHKEKDRLEKEGKL